MPMIEAVERFVRTHGDALNAGFAALWVVIGLAAAVLAARDRGRRSLVWIAAALLGLAFAIEMRAGVRYGFTGFLKQGMGDLFGQGAVDRRRPVQAAVIVGLAVLAGVGLLGFLWRARRLGIGRVLVIAGLGVSLFGFTLETISLHQIDQYYSIYWTIWLAGLLTTALGVAAAWRSGPTERAGARAEGPGVVDDSTHARYRITASGVQRVEVKPPGSARPEANRPEGAGPRLIRLALVLLVLALPEFVHQALRLIGGGG